MSCWALRFRYRYEGMFADRDELGLLHVSHSAHGPAWDAIQTICGFFLLVFESVSNFGDLGFIPTRHSHRFLGTLNATLSVERPASCCFRPQCFRAVDRESQTEELPGDSLMYLVRLVHPSLPLMRDIFSFTRPHSAARMNQHFARFRRMRAYSKVAQKAAQRCNPPGTYKRSQRLSRPFRLFHQPSPADWYLGQV